MTTQYNPQNIRSLLTEGFDDEELRKFCFEKQDFKQVYHQLSHNTGKATIVSSLIDYATRRGLVENILTWAEAENPKMYDKFQPYYEVDLDEYLNPDEILRERFRVLGPPIDKGGAGAIYRGWDRHLSGFVAIKENFILTRHGRQQFKEEARLLNKLNCPGVPSVYDYFDYKGRYYFVMKFIEGQNLWEKIGNGKYPLSEYKALNYIIQICDVVGCLHQQKPQPIIHRDIKPKNIKITPEDRAMLVDFGIAKEASSDHTKIGAQGISDGFSPPEQYVGGTTVKTDIYALGATLYAILAGREPVTSIDRLNKTGELKPINKIRPELSEAIAGAIEWAMQLDPNDRPATVGEWGKRLEEILKETPLPDQDEDIINPAPPPRLTLKDKLSFIITAAHQIIKKGGISLLVGLVFVLLGFLVWGIYIWSERNSQANETATAIAATKTALASNTLTKTPTPTHTHTALPTNTPNVTVLPGPSTPTPFPTLAPEICKDKAMVRVTGGIVKVAEITLTLISDFCLDPYEVTIQKYQECESCEWPDQYDQEDWPNKLNDPIVWITWEEAQNYCRNNFAEERRLPTGAEWDLAIRGLITSTLDITTHSTIRPVGEYSEDENKGIYDLWGNVHEWVDEKYENLSGRVEIRGKSFSPDRTLLTRSPNEIAGNIGFRCAWRP